MPRSDLLLKLVQSGNKGDKELFTKTVEAIISEEHGKKHSTVANQLQQALREQSSMGRSFVSTNQMGSNQRIDSLVYEQIPSKKISDLILDADLVEVCHEIIEEQHRADLLRSHNLEPRNRILLVGPPGTGKTSLAEAIAYDLMIPFFSVKYEGIIGSFLGETANKLKLLFDYIKTQRCVLFFDEFDAIGKERGDAHETGEIKRVVSSLLLQIDKLPSYVVVIAATNHPELLDRAVWRRFQSRLNLPKPTLKNIEQYLRKFEKSFGKSLGHPISGLARKLSGQTFSEIEEFTVDVLRKHILSTPSSAIKIIISNKLKEISARYVHGVKRRK